MDEEEEEEDYQCTRMTKGGTKPRQPPCMITIMNLASRPKANVGRVHAPRVAASSVQSAHALQSIHLRSKHRGESTSGQARWWAASAKSFVGSAGMTSCISSSGHYSAATNMYSWCSIRQAGGGMTG